MTVCDRVPVTRREPRDPRAQDAAQAGTRDPEALLSIGTQDGLRFEDVVETLSVSDADVLPARDPKRQLHAQDVRRRRRRKTVTGGWRGSVLRSLRARGIEPTSQAFDGLQVESLHARIPDPPGESHAAGSVPTEHEPCFEEPDDLRQELARPRGILVKREAQRAARSRRQRVEREETSLAHGARVPIDRVVVAQLDATAARIQEDILHAQRTRPVGSAFSFARAAEALFEPRVVRGDDAHMPRPRVSQDSGHGGSSEHRASTPVHREDEAIPFVFARAGRDPRGKRQGYRQTVHDRCSGHAQRSSSRRSATARSCHTRSAR